MYILSRFPLFRNALSSPQNFFDTIFHSHFQSLFVSDFPELALAIPFSAGVSHLLLQTAFAASDSDSANFFVFLSATFFLACVFLRFPVCFLNNEFDGFVAFFSCFVISVPYADKRITVFLTQPFRAFLTRFDAQLCFQCAALFGKVSCSMALRPGFDFPESDRAL